MKPSLEVLAPAGDPEKLRYALAYGAHAVYAGQPQYSLRARDNGFQTVEQVAQAIEYCHAQGRQFYLTSNILPHNNKVRAFRASLEQYIALGPDALIMTDPGMIAWVKDRHPEQAVHLSVQANCTNWSSAEYWYRQGVSRIILSRELRLREIEEIHAAVPQVELEAFVHGAVCMAHSGRCMLSNYMSFRDANQGMCSNACRFPYKTYAENVPQGALYESVPGKYYLEDSANAPGELMPLEEDEYGTYFMSSKDLCAIGVLDRLAAAGVISFKIEGRTKSLYYLAQVVRAYCGAVADVEGDLPISDLHLQRALSTDSRGFMPGYFGGPGELPQNYTETRQRSPYGRIGALVDAYDSEKGELIVSPRENISRDESLLLVSPSHERVIQASEMRNHRGEPCDTLLSGTRNCRICFTEDPGPFALLVKVGDAVPAEILQDMRREGKF